MNLQAWKGRLEPRQDRGRPVKKGQAAAESGLYQVQADEGQFETLAHPA